MVCHAASRSSGSKRKSSESDGISSSTLICPEGRDERTKKAKKSSSKRWSKLIIEEEYSKMTLEHQQLRKMKEQQMEMMQQ
ncbi:hypothetical protein LIER_35801 [Lithospermum erythrorhizon]|uniref:Uncharacterized protein n=1 Tax=Lithospermum erythrorhizon TaxID=34254 RepID=A0AAV3NWW5_LITER